MQPRCCGCMPTAVLIFERGFGGVQPRRCGCRPPFDLVHVWWILRIVLYHIACCTSINRKFLVGHCWVVRTGVRVMPCELLYSESM